MNGKTLTGYLISSFIEAVLVYVSGAIAVITLILIVGFCLFAVGFVSDIEENLRQLNDDLIVSNEKELTSEERLNVKKRYNIEKQLNIRKRLTDIMAFHSEAKEFSDVLQVSFDHILILNFLLSLFRFTTKFFDINTGVIFVYLLYTSMSFCILLMQMNMVIIRELILKTGSYLKIGIWLFL